MIIRSPWRNLLPALAFLSLAVLAATLVFRQRFQDDLQVLLGHEGLRTARLAARMIDETPQNPEAIGKLALEISKLADGRLTVIAPDGSVLADSSHDPRDMDNHGARPEIVAARDKGWGQSIRRSSTIGADMIYTAVRRVDAAGTLKGYVRFARRLDRVKTLTASTVGTVWIAAAVVILLGMLACYLLIEIRIAREERLREGDTPSGPHTG